MGLFVSTYRSKVDSKSRVSMPAAFRAIVQDDSVFAYCSLLNECIVVCTQASMLELYNYIENLEMFSPEREAISTAILGGSEQIRIDTKGRIVLSERLLQFAGITTDVTFLGKGNFFEIWESKRFAEYAQKAREYAITNKLKWGGKDGIKA